MVKKIATAVLALSLSGAVLAGGYGHGHHRHHHHSHGNRWVGPAIVGGLILGSIIASNQSRAVIVEPAPVIVQPAPQVQQVVPSSCMVDIVNPYTNRIETVVVQCNRTAPVPSYTH